MSFRPGPRNLITDVAGLAVGNAQDHRLKSGVTALLCDPAAVASVKILGGAPGTRETDILEPDTMTGTVNALVLAGGSAFGLDAASGVQAWLRERGRGFEVRGHLVPIVPAAILLDLPNGGDKNWGRYPPYREMGYAACEAASADFAIGTSGAGTGALTAGLKGGLGSASAVLPNGIIVGALVAVNAVASVTVGRGAHFWAAPFEQGDEFGGLGLPHPMPADATEVLLKHREVLKPGANTTIAIVATDAKLTKAEARRMAIGAHDGFARAIWPVHTPVDGDLVFGVATGRGGQVLDLEAQMDLHAAAGMVMARAIARAVFAATPEQGDLFPTWAERRAALGS